MKKPFIPLFLILIFFLPFGIKAEDRHDFGFLVRLRPNIYFSESNPRDNGDVGNTYIVGLFYEYHFYKPISLRFSGTYNHIQYNAGSAINYWGTSWRDEEGTGNIFALNADLNVNYEIFKNILIFASAGGGLKFASLSESWKSKTYDSITQETEYSTGEHEWKETKVYLAIEAGFKFRIVKQLELAVSYKMDRLNKYVFLVDSDFSMNLGVNIYIL